VDAFGFVARQNNGGPQYYDLVDSGPVEGEISPYVSDLPVPILTASHGVATYTIMINNLSALMSIADFGDIVIEEYVTKNNLSMVQESDKSNAYKWTQASPATKNSPTSVLATDGLHRWVRAYAEDFLGGKSAYSTYVEVTPTPVPTAIPTQNTQPTAAMKKISTVYFALNSYLLDAASKAALRNVALKIMKSPQKLVLIYGNTDAQGGANNTVLSHQRAIAAFTFMRPLLVGKTIKLGWFAATRPAVAGNTQAAYAKNRRVEIWVN